MATANATAAQKLKESPEVVRARETEARIIGKLNFDGRYDRLHPLESQSRFAKLTNSELEFLGRIMGWSVPYYRGVDWDAVPSTILAESIMRPDGLELIQSLYPAPTGADRVNWAEVSEDELHLVATNKTTIKELQEKYPVLAKGAKK